MTGSLAAATLWITVRRSTERGRRCRDYAVCDPAGKALLAARAFVWERVINITGADSGQLVLVLRRRLAFPLTGRVDVLSSPGREPRGAVYRSGRFADARGRTAGRFRDARSLRARAGEGLLAGLADVLTGAEGSQVSAPNAYVCTIGERPAGTLAHTALPWPETAMATVEPPALIAATRRLLPERARRFVSRLGRPAGWRFQREPPLLAVDPLLAIGAAIFMVELSQW